MTFVQSIKEFLQNHQSIKYFVKYLFIKLNCIFIYRLRKRIKGKNNIVKYKNTILKKCFFDIIGNNNTIIIEYGCNLNKVHFYIRGNNNKIILHEEIKFIDGGTFWTTCDNGYIEIGKKTTAEGNVNLQIAENNLKIIIKNDCMFSSNISIWTQDWHHILDKDGNRINNGKDVVINEHVWIGYDTKILKGVTIGKNNIIGTNTVITKTFIEEQVIIAGNPGRIVKRDVNWKR
jgi:acetyltransferase-like isoleucine patch superfamily enzyme